MADPADLQQVGPWPRGVANTFDETDPRYSPNDAGAYLREAVNVDVDNVGWVRRRGGRSKLLDLTDAHSAAFVGGRFLLVDDGALYEAFPDPVGLSATRTAIASGLSNDLMSYCHAGGRVWWCNGSQAGHIDETGSAGMWWVPEPFIPTLTATAGNLPAGRYMVALTSQIGERESGCFGTAAITLTETGGITVGPLLVEQSAETINVYLSDTNDEALLWAISVPVGTSTVDLVAPAQSTDLLRTLNFTGPPDGARIVREFQGSLVVVADRDLYWSDPLGFHLFKRDRDVVSFADLPVMLEVLQQGDPAGFGFYLAEGPRTWWIGADWQRRLVDTRPVLAGSALWVPGTKLPRVETTAMVLVWVTHSGPVAGLPGGVIVPLTEDVVAMDGYEQASVAYREQDGLAQILMSMKGKRGDATTRLATADRMDAVVIRGGG
jgi:hypothetical protein